MIDGVKAVVKDQSDYSQRTLAKPKSAKQIEKLEGDTETTPILDSEGDNRELTKDQIQQAINKMNKTMETYNTELRFQFHEKSGEYIVKLINTQDDSVVREIPPERVLNMVAYFKEMLGIVVDKFA